MSNPITIEPTEFNNVRTGNITYGYRAYDNDGQTYGNCFDSVPDDDFDFLKLCLAEENAVLSAMLTFCEDQKEGLFIGSTWYDYDEIKHLF